MPSVADTQGRALRVSNLMHGFRLRKMSQTDGSGESDQDTR
jgi:hypothetical protein